MPRRSRLKKISAAITTATTLSGAANSNSIASNFAAGDTITVNGVVVTFVAAGAVGNQLNVGDTIGTLLAKIDSITGAGTPSSVTSGAITIHTGLTSDLTLSSSNAAAFGALGFTGTATAVRGGGGTVGTGVVIGSDNQTFLDESISGGAVTAYDGNGAPVSIQLRWAKTDSATLGLGHVDTWNLFYQVNPNATGGAVKFASLATGLSVTYVDFVVI